LETFFSLRNNIVHFGNQSSSFFFIDRYKQQKQKKLILYTDSFDFRKGKKDTWIYSNSEEVKSLEKKPKAGVFVI